MIRVMEWDDPRAKYPNLWRDNMPCQILANNRAAGRLRLGDLIAVYHPISQRHPKRSKRFLGLSRVIGLRRSYKNGLAWVDLESSDFSAL